jgi:uncharacterized protein
MSDEDLLTTVRSLAEARTPSHDPAHDFAHACRVAATADRIARAEQGDVATVVAASLCHELFSYPKDHADSKRSGDICAEHAERLLRDAGFSRERSRAVCACIRDHAFSKGVAPGGLEARIVQDADRLDATGAIGIARCFATAGALGRPLYAPADPFCVAREPDDRLYTLDHFYRKLHALSPVRAA